MLWQPSAIPSGALDDVGGIAEAAIRCAKAAIARAHEASSQVRIGWNTGHVGNTIFNTTRLVAVVQ